MFKTAATKIAHNSTLPALGGNQDLRPLQDLITAEKAVIVSLQKLSVDYSKAAEALRAWGITEGDDLGDILSASTVMLNHFSSSLSQYATHGHTIRESLKTIRTREEALDELKRRRRVVSRKADDAERKLSKMGPEHKHLAMQTETLNRLKDEIRIMDSDILIEEAAIGDFKRSMTKGFLGLKFGGLVECCDRGRLAGEYGRLIVTEIPEEPTQPGLPRPFYYGQNKTSALANEANQRISEIQLTAVQTLGIRDRRQYERPMGPGQIPGGVPGTPTLGGMGYNQPNDSYAASSFGGVGGGGGMWASSNDSKPQPLPPPRTSSSSDQLPPGGIGRPSASGLGGQGGELSAPGSPTTPHTASSFSNFSQAVFPPTSPMSMNNQRPGPGGGSGFSQTFSAGSSARQPLQLQPQSQTMGQPGGYGSQGNNEAVDEFGVPMAGRSLGPMDGLGGGGGAGGRFATFPVKSRQQQQQQGPDGLPPSSLSSSPPGQPPSLGPSLRLPSSTGPAGGSGGIGGGREDDDGGLGLSFSASIAEALGDSLKGLDTGLGAGSKTQPQDKDKDNAQSSPPPSIDVVAPNNPFASFGSSPTGGIPPGAAPPDPNKRWISEDPSTGLGVTGKEEHKRTLSGNDDALLAYMTTAMMDADGDTDTPPGTAGARGGQNRFETTGPSRQHGLRVGVQGQEDGEEEEGEGEDKRVSRHVRFGQVEDVDEELERRASEDKEKERERKGKGREVQEREWEVPPTTAALDAEFEENEDKARQRRRGFVPQSPPRNTNTNAAAAGNSGSPPVTNNLSINQTTPPLPSLNPASPPQGQPQPTPLSVAADNRNGASPTDGGDKESKEKALDLAAAKEIARELESLKGSQPNSPNDPHFPSATPGSLNTAPTTTTNRVEIPPASMMDHGRPEFSYSITNNNTNTNGNSSNSSPLLPPNAPFAQRNISPAQAHPYADLNHPPPPQLQSQSQSYGGSYGGGSNNYQQPPVTAAQAYAQSYQDSQATQNMGNLNVVIPDYGPTIQNPPQGQAQPPPLSPAQAYAQSYQKSQPPIPTQAQDAPPSSPPNNNSIYIPNSATLPPRFQALQQQAENAKPPRFREQQQQQQREREQQREQQGASSALPPRFQNASAGSASNAAVAGAGPGLGPGGAVGASPYGSLGSAASGSATRLGALGAGVGGNGGGGGGEGPYRLGIPTFNRSATSLNTSNLGPGGGGSGTSSPIPPPPSGARTISAAAFKRPAKNTSVDNLLPPLGGGGDGGFKRSLPSSPYPPSGQPNTNNNNAIPISAPAPSQPISVVGLTQQQQQRPRGDSQSSLPLPSGMIGGGPAPPLAGGPSAGYTLTPPPPSQGPPTNIYDPQPPQSSTMRHSVLPPGAQRPVSELPDDFQYDYINAYMGSSPQREDFGLPDPYANSGHAPAPSGGGGMYGPQGGRQTPEYAGIGAGGGGGGGGNLAGWGRPRVGAYSDTRRLSRNVEDDSLR